MQQYVVRQALGLYGWARPPCDSPRELSSIGPDCDGGVQWTMNKIINMDANNENQTPQGTSTPNQPDQKQISKKRKQILSEEDENDLLYSRFFVISAKDGNPIKFNIFAIQKFIQCGVGDVKVA